MKESKQRKPAPAQNGTASGNEYAGTRFSDEICYCLVRKITRLSRLVTVESTRSRQGQVILDLHDVFTWFVRLQKTDLCRSELYINYAPTNKDSALLFCRLLPSFLLHSKVPCDFQLQYNELHLSIRLRPHHKVEYKKQTESFRFHKDSLHLLRPLKDHGVLPGTLLLAKLG
jgi:hypothetical protein